MGLCVSCRKSKGKFKGHCGINKEYIGFLPSKSSRTCNQIQSSNHETKNCNSLNLQSAGSPQSEAMAASFSNMNLTNPIKGLVSKKRNRYKEDGFDLDLSYITNSIIAMGYPASNIESVYRNNIEDVVKFLDQKHSSHYMIYNLCSERVYDKSKFQNRVRDFPFDDHNPPNIESLAPFCQDVDGWLQKDPKNVAVVHCKAGKGRTGTMICCYLLHSGICSTAKDALELYGEKRTQDTKGVTIPSQMRYVRYYEQLVKNPSLIYTPKTVYIKEIILEPGPTVMGGLSNLSFVAYESFPGTKLREAFRSEVYKISTTQDDTFPMPVNRLKGLTGDVKIEFCTSKMRRKEKLFHFWFNTFFMGELDSDVIGYDSALGEDCFNIVFRKNELDKLNKRDKQHKIFSENFKLTMVVRKSNYNTVPVNPAICKTSKPPTTSTPSESSAASSDDTDDEEWDSVVMDPDPDLFDPRGVGYRILSECELASQLTSSSGENHSEILMV